MWELLVFNQGEENTNPFDIKIDYEQLTFATSANVELSTQG